MADVDILLFGLRAASALVLMAFLALVLSVLWRDYRATVATIEASRRSYGQLVALVEVDDQLLRTNETYPLLPLTTLGRNPANTVCVDDSFASSDHARIVLRGGQWWLEDRRSRNGTTLNDLLVSEPIIMTDGDIIGIGSRRFRLELS